LDFPTPVDDETGIPVSQAKVELKSYFSQVANNYSERLSTETDQHGNLNYIIGLNPKDNLAGTLGSEPPLRGRVASTNIWRKSARWGSESVALVSTSAILLSQHRNTFWRGRDASDCK
jgi:hypothetical protein